MDINWVKDYSVKKCPSCKAIFSILTRRHHCRKCGFIYCFNCINNQKICSNCYNYIKPENVKLIHIFQFLKLNLKDYEKLKLINKYFYKLYKNYVEEFQILYLKIPYVKNIDNQILLENKELLLNNRRWNLHLLNTSNYKISLSNKNINTLFIINLLYLKKHPSETVDEIVEKLYIQTISELFSYSYYFINLLLIYDLIDSYIFFIKYLISKLIIYTDHINLFFWQINYYFCTSKKVIFENLLKELVKIGTLGTTHKLFIKTYDFCQNISILNKDNNNYKNIMIHLQQNRYFVSEFLLPLYKNKNNDFKLSNIKKIDSNSNPIQFQFIDKSNTVVNILFKNGNIQKEFIIMNLIIIFKNYLQEFHNMNLAIITYDIVPLFQETGIIEIIDNCESLYSIKEYHKMTIQNYIFEKNNNITINDFRDNFIKSCAPTVVISYIFGVGDRHLENILITKDGFIFNIDFEYLLGNEPSFLFKSTKLRITYDMLDALGGINSRYYQKFIDLCLLCFQHLRKLNILMFTTFKTLQLYSEDSLYNYFNDILYSDLSVNEALQKFRELLHNSCKNIYTYSLRDYIHKYVKS